MLEFCVWEGKGTNLVYNFKPIMKNIEFPLLGSPAVGVVDGVIQ